MRRYLLILFYSLLYFQLPAQNAVVSGLITDNQTGEFLIGAHIYDKTGLTGILSNEYGFYSLRIKGNDSVKIVYSFTGYRDTVIYILPDRDYRIDIGLEPGLNIGEVTVTGRISRECESPEVAELPAKDVKHLPSLGGEFDLMKAFQLMPGVQTGNEGNSGLYVRGGSPDQNLVLLDDVPLYYVNHLGGFISTFNPDAINNTELIKGAFPAKYGTRLSSILDVRMKEGNQKQFAGSGTIGMLSSKLSVEGPIKKDTSSFIISARRFLYDLLYRPLSKYLITEGYSAGYSFYDLNGKVNYRLSDKDRLYLSWYSGDDKTLVKYKEPGVVGDKSKGVIAWGNLLGSVRWNHIYNNKLFSNISINYTRFRYVTKVMYEQLIDDNKFGYESNSSSSVHDISAKADYRYFPADYLSVEFGGSGTWHIFRPSVNNFRQVEGGKVLVDSVLNSNNISAWEQSLYLDTKAKLYGYGILSAGVRANGYFVDGKSYLGVDPRLGLQIFAGSSTIINGSFTMMMQPVHCLTMSSSDIPVDLWMPSTSVISPSASKQWTAGISQIIGGGKYKLSVDWYKKKMNNLIAYKEGAFITGSSGDWQDLVEKDGTGNSYGVEILLKKEEGNTRGWIAYTCSKTTRQFSGLNEGNPFPYKYDRRHDISIVLMHRFNDNIDASATWVYGTGNAYTMPLGKYDIGFIDESEGEVAYIYGERNGARMKPYHRLDLAVNFRKEKKWGERVWNISIYNAYNRQNPYFYYVDTEWSYKGSDNWSSKQVMKQQSLFPVIPSVSYSFKF